MTQPSKRSFKRKFRVCYPPGAGTLVIRTDLNWERDVHPSALSSDGSTATFEIEAQQPFAHFKPCLIKNGSLHWAGFYLDSGWPGDNYEVTVAMALALVSKGWRYGRDLLYLCFPHAAHDEKAWGMRLHLPMQLFTGIVAGASRSVDPLLQNPPE